MTVPFADRERLLGMRPCGVQVAGVQLQMGQVREQRRFHRPQVPAEERPIPYCGKVVERAALAADRLYPFSVMAEYLTDAELTREARVRLDRFEI